MLINFALTTCAILVVTDPCFGIHFLELPGFDSDVSHEHADFKKPSTTDPNTGGAHRPHHKKSIDYKHLRRMQVIPQTKSKELDKYHDTDISSLKIPAHENSNQEVEDTVKEYEHGMIKTKVSAENENMEFRSIDKDGVVKTGGQYINPLLKQEMIPINGVEKAIHWRNTQIPIAKGNREFQNNNAASAQINRQNLYPTLKQEVHGEVRNKYPLLKQEVTPLYNINKRSWWHTRVPVERGNMEAQNINAAEIVQTQHQSRYPPIIQKVREDMEPHNTDDRYPPLRDKVRENMEPYKNDDELQNRYPPFKPRLRENIMIPQNVDVTQIIQTQRQNGYPPLKQKIVQDMESQNDDAVVQIENEERPLRQRDTTDYYIERRHWLVARKDGDTSNNIPPINKDDKDATLKAKINVLVNQTVQDTKVKVDSIKEVKKAHEEKAPYKIGFLVSSVKKSRDVLNELFNVAVKHRDEWKALEQLKIFELIVHTNVDTTNLVRQLVEIHVQHLNSTSSGGDETTDAPGGGRRVVLI